MSSSTPGPPSTTKKPSPTYASTGVDIEAGDRLVELIRPITRRTFGPRVLGPHGGFAGMFRLDFNEQLFKRNYKEPVLVACTDGVGTKVKLAADLDILDTVGIDCVAMNVNDLIVQGAEPLFFLDYLGLNTQNPERTAAIIAGVAKGCEIADCALIGGECAEMPDIYSEGDFDLAGFAVGVVELHRAIDCTRMEVGDIIIGLASDGVHSNGFSLVRHIIDQAGLDLGKSYEELGTDETLGRVLLTPTRIYSRPIVRVLRNYRVKRVVSAMSHITGGGLPGNVCRTLGKKVDARIDLNSFPVPPIFTFLQERGGVDTDEMYRVFNMGIGYTVVVRPTFANAVLRRLERFGEKPYVIGSIEAGTGDVHLDR